MDLQSFSPSPDSCAKVFNVIELAEQILLDLSLQDLLCSAQRVSKQWHSVIAHSLAIQQALFLRPVGRAPLHYTALPTPHPSIAQSPTCEDGWFEPGPTTRAPRRRAVIENPLISRVLQSQLHATTAPVHAAASPRLCVPAIRHPHASWRRMLVAQPPLREATVTRKSERGPAEKVVVRSDAAGVTLDMLALPLLDKAGMAALSIAGWYLWQTSGLRDEAREVRSRMLQRR